ncbi:MAG: AAA family ATPase [Thiofilum sp.]|uniref:AAA family ATPase n=1 Tax=Thiofilum sp. TaxID=2212733 RepID=UPI0025E6839E|nr:AAA family ATPase [Thiofilum sp.]MBK8455157.1 AAA family ATPase [Thiofilum sp.]
MNRHLKIPYGLSNFKTVISEGYTYVDKTAYIAKLEQAGKYQILLRPRRFGKSLFISMLEYYYSMDHRDEFDSIFDNLAISKQLTDYKSSYEILFMEFSGIETASYEALYAGFNVTVQTYLQKFLRRYQYPQITLDELNNYATPADKLKYVLSLVSDQGLYLLIDEYDHFANAVLADDQSLFLSIMGKGGFVRSFYEVIKSATHRGSINRIFITGVTALMLDSLTSGFNIAQNLSFDKNFNEAMGFTHHETLNLLQPLIENCQLEPSKLMSDVTNWYNGYRFHPQSKEAIFNSDMVLYFIQEFDKEHCTYPRRMLDDNIASDYGKIMALFNIGDREANYQVLDELINEGQVPAQYRRKFDLEKGFDRDDFISLLAYMGFVTLQGETLTGELFGMPNQVIRELYFQYFKVELERRNQIKISSRDLELAIQALGLQGELQLLATEMQKALQLLSNRDSMKMDEQHLKTLLLTLLYQFPVYFIQSEREMNRKYPDIMLLERSPYKVKFQHLIELKYAKKGEGEKGWKAKQQEGIEQVQGYLLLPEIMRLKHLKAWVVVSDGEQLACISV